MKPLAQALDELAHVGTVVFDIDDTVTRAGRLERVAFDAMWRLHDAGVRLVAVTGRPLGWADVVARQWPVVLAVGENGAGWVHRRDGRVREGYFHDARTRVAQAAVAERILARVRAEMPRIALASDQRARRCDLAFDVAEEVALPAADVARLVALIESEGARAPVSSVHAHALVGDWDKARGVVAAADDALGETLEAPCDGWLFVGDSENDAAAFELFELSVGVANVREHLPRLLTPPRLVTERDRGEGFAELADAILLARRGARG